MSTLSWALGNPHYLTRVERRTSRGMQVDRRDYFFHDAGMVFALLPIAVWLLLAVLLLVRWRMGIRGALLAAALGGAAWVVATTEILSFFGAIDFGAILAAWIVPGGILGWLVYREREPLKTFQLASPKLSTPQKLLVAAIGLCLGVAWLQASMTAPATSDAMAYHLQRQVFWMQDHDVANYPANSLRQLVMPPLAEYAGLHLMILTGDDGAHNFLQWTALLLMTLAATLITGKYAGGSVTAQLLAALAVVTIPMAFIQGSNTKNDDILALWTMAALWYTLRFDEAEWSWRNAALAGLSFGAMLMTKGTALFFGLPIVALAGILLVRRHPRRAGAALGVMVAIVLAMNACAYGRNWRSFGTPFPNDPAINGGDTLINEDYSPPALVSNLVRNVAPHLTLPYQPWNDGLTEAVAAIHRWLGRGVNDPKTTYAHGRYFPYLYAQQAEDAATATPQMLFVLLLPVLLFLGRRTLPMRIIGMLLAIVVVDFLLFCVLLKCQMWNVRLLVPVFVIVAPVTGWVLAQPKLRYFASAWAALLVIALVPTMNMTQRPLWGPRSIFTRTRVETRFPESAETMAPVLTLADRIVTIAPRRIAFSTGWSSLDYTLQRLLLDRMKTPPRFSAFNPIFRVPGRDEGDPDLVLAFENRDLLKNDLTGTVYRPVGYYVPYVVYVKESMLGGTTRR